MNWKNLEIGKRIDIEDCEHRPYLTRWHLIRVGERFALMLHKFHRSDEDRELHDHPWSFITLILTKGYWEHREICQEHDGASALRPCLRCKLGTVRGIKRYWYPRFSVLFRRAEWRHRVEIKNAPVYTLVLRLGRRREWGFWNKAGQFTHWKLWWRNNCET